MPHEGNADPISNDRPEFHSDMPVSKLAERDTRVIEASVVSSTPPVAETMDGVTHEIWPTLTNPNGAWGLEPPNPNSGIQLTEVRRPAREGLEATSRRTESGEKMQMSPSGLCLTHSEVDRVILTFSFDRACRISTEERSAGHLSRSPEQHDIYREAS